MGFLTTATTTTITARLTPFGRQQLVSTNNSLITSFSLGDSDANYIAALTLGTGKVPSIAGNIGPNSTTSNSTAQNVALRSQLIVNSSGLLRKPVERQSSTVITEYTPNTFTTVSGSSISRTLVNRNNYNSDANVNLFYSFGLPLNSTNDTTYTGVTFANGGYSDTTLSGLAQTNILVIGIDNTTYGECIDGKTIKLDLPTSAGTYTIYSTFQKKSTPVTIEDANIRETSVVTNNIGQNIALLFSDNIKKPNGVASSAAGLSWGTGYNTVRPFSVNGKQLYNLQTNSNLGLTADTTVGVAYLDKGFLVITDPQIIADYDTNTASATTISFNSVSSSVSQNITCIAGRGEFGISTNPTFTPASTPRITEIGLYDNLGNLIAVGKTDKQVTKNINEFLAFNVTIKL